VTFNVLFLVLLFLFGSSIGSFINVLVDRYDKLHTIFTSQSKCEKCKKKIAFYDLIPIFSYFVLGGKCRHCRASIPKRVVLVEILTGISFVVVGVFIPFSSVFFSIILLLIVSSIMALFFVDLEHGILPDYLLIALAILSILFNLNIGIIGLGVNFFVGLVLFAIFLALFLVTRGRGIGFGDVKFAFVIGLLLGFPNSLAAIYISFVLGALVSILLIATGRKKMRGDTIPFGPFLAGGILVMLLFSERVYEFIFFIFNS